jgi:TetR/AcrR family transcriptional regulator
MNMGIKERKEREKKIRREEIIQAAKKLIAKHGVEGMTMNQVANLVELNKATLYLYFGNKDDLIDAVVHEGLAALEKRYREADQPYPSGLARVLALMKKSFLFYRQHPIYFYALNHQERRTPGERLNTPHAAKADEIANRLFGTLQESLRQGQKDGSIRSDIDVKQVSLLTYAHIYGVMHSIYSKKDIYEDVLHLEPEAIERSALELMAYYLR